MKPNKLCTSKIQWWDRQRLEIPTLKGRNRKGGDRSQASPKLTGITTLDQKA